MQQKLVGQTLVGTVPLLKLLRYWPAQTEKLLQAIDEQSSKHKGQLGWPPKNKSMSFKCWMHTTR